MLSRLVVPRLSLGCVSPPLHRRGTAAAVVRMSAAAAPPEGGGALSASDPTSLLDRSSFKEELRLWALRLPSTACEAALKALRKGASNLAFTRPKLRTIIPDPAASHGAEGGAVTRLLLLDDVLFPRPAAGGAPPGTRGRAGDDDDRDDVPLF